MRKFSAQSEKGPFAMVELESVFTVPSKEYQLQLNRDSLEEACR
jgi:hypothetical protein